MKKILYFLSDYPALTETYKKVEIEAVRFDYDVKIIANFQATDPYKNHIPYTIVGYDEERIVQEVRDFKPDVLHTHWLLTNIGEISRRTGVPFTIRSHSFDTCWRGQTPDYVAKTIPYINTDLCLGVLAFPFAFDNLIRAGIDPKKLVATGPVVDVQRFNDRRPNGTGVMGLGAFLPKKNMEDFLKVAKMGIVKREFNLWAVEQNVEKLWELNDEMGKPVNQQLGAQPEEMPAIYKQHEWILLTANRERSTVGWSICVAEAQASGVGVLIPDLRPDQHEFAGPSAYFYHTLEEAAAILAEPYPAEKRLAAFEHCQQWDFRFHKRALTDLWDRV